MQLESDKLIKLLPTSENVITAHMEIGVMSLDHTNVKNAIPTCRNISLSAGSVEFWRAIIGAGETDYETVIWEWASQDSIMRCRGGGKSRDWRWKSTLRHVNLFHVDYLYTRTFIN